MSRFAPAGDTRGMRRQVVLTGASSGIGRALAPVLAARGDSLILVARRADLLDEVAATCRRAGGEARALPVDVADPDALVAASSASAL
jgi:short-subunit dehydrogenase